MPDARHGLLVILVVALIFPELPVGTSLRRPRPRPPPSPLRAALLFAGLPGHLTNDEHYSNLNGGDSLAALQFAWASWRAHFIDANPAWAVDVFFHTWNSKRSAEIASLLSARAYASGPVILDGMRFDSGPYASAEAAYQLAQREANSTPYDRVVLSRFDGTLLRAFNLSQLTEDNALYTANWCLASGDKAPSPSSSWKGCKFIQTFRHDPHGVADYYFAGSQSTMAIYLSHFASDLQKGRSRSAGPQSITKHGFWMGRLKHFEGEFITLRHYLYHIFDIAMARTVQPCCGPNFTSGTSCSQTEFFGSREPSTSASSECESGRFACVAEETKLHTCSFFALKNN
jgi:hypothetical protein